MQKKKRGKFFVFEIIACEFVARNCLGQADNPCHRQSMCEQTVLGFCVLLKKIFSNVPNFKVFNKYCKGAAIQISTKFRPICHVVFLRVL